MATLAVRTINFGVYTLGATPTCVITATPAGDAATVDGDQFRADDRTFLEVGQTSNPLVFNVVAQKVNEDGVLMHVRVPTAIGSRYFCGPFGSRYVHADGYVKVTYPSGVTGMTIAAYRLAMKGLG